jgi:predicted dehydrogenase
VTTLESPFRPYVEGYALAPPSPAAPELIARLRSEDEQRLHAALPDADEQTRYCYRWMLLDNLVHELNALRGALGEPELVKYAELSPRVVNLSLVFDGVDCHLSWVDVPGIARYRQELAFYGLDARATLTLPSPYLRGMPSELALEGGEAGSSHAWRTVETVSYIEAFKRELIEFHAAIGEGRPARTDGADGLHDVALCRSIAHVHMTGEPVARPSELQPAEVQA